jgi:hypothetical protein
MRRNFSRRAGTGQDMIDTFEFGLRDYGESNPGHHYHSNPGHHYHGHTYAGADLRNLSELPGAERAEAISSVLATSLMVGGWIGTAIVIGVTGGAASAMIPFVVGAVGGAAASADGYRDCQNLYQWGGWKRDDRQTAADVMNGVYRGLAYYLEKTCQKRCELAWWVNQRQWHHTDKASLESKLQDGVPISDQHGCGKEGQCGRLNEYGQITDFAGKAPSSATERELRAVLASAPMPGPDIWFLPGWFEDKTDCTISDMLTEAVVFYADLIAEYNQMNDMIRYEMGQRDNLVKLRDQKGIEAWHLEIIYADRDERMAATNPESTVVQDNIADEKARPYIWLGIGTAVAMGAILVGGAYRNKARGL